VTPLHFAAGNIEEDDIFNEGNLALQTLLEAGANIEAKNKNGITPLMWAVMNKHMKAIEMLLTYNALTEEVDQKGKTALMHAQERGLSAIEDILRSRLSSPRIFLPSEVDPSPKSQLSKKSKQG
jgi:uncharacterized protein